MEGGERNAHKLPFEQRGEERTIHGENEMRWQSVAQSLDTGISTALYWSYPECTVVSSTRAAKSPHSQHRAFALQKIMQFVARDATRLTPGTSPGD